MKLEVLTLELLFLLAAPPTAQRGPETEMSWAFLPVTSLGPGQALLPSVQMVVGGLASGALEARGSPGPCCIQAHSPLPPFENGSYPSWREDLPAFKISQECGSDPERLGWTPTINRRQRVLTLEAAPGDGLEVDFLG